ncbi:MAG: hypothetical protein CVU84_11235 [Firmicutes bacterium HGW-Firmicutes-1]|jgi:ABC-type multidrug transport system fused ATPase/permease subunit|nr:MAG: hypothetical protein CVU84_11235 [Firmicutes bacterium HGW-Firmicutes-1]
MHHRRYSNNKKVYSWLCNQIKGYKLDIFKLICLNIVISFSTVSIALITKQIIDNALNKNINAAIKFAILFGIVEMVHVISSYIYPILRTKFREKLTNHLQGNFMHQFYHLDWLSSSRHHTGEYHTYLSNDIPKVVNGIVDIITTIFAFIFQLLLAFMALFYFDPLLAIFACFIGPTSVIFSKLWRQKLKLIAHMIQNTESRFLSLINETLENNIIIKAFQLEKPNSCSISELQNDRFHQHVEHTKITAFGNIALNLGYRGSFFIAFIWGAFRISQGLTTYGTFAAFLQLIGNIQDPIEILSQTLPKVINTFSSAERLIYYENLPKEIPYLTSDFFLHAPIGVKIDGLHFKYTEELTIFNNATLYIKPGIMTGIAGASGQGKTTLLYILLGLITPHLGQVELFDPENMQTIYSGTRQYFSYVPQGNTLFSGSIYENLCISNPHATIEEIYNALKIACAYDFISQLEQGMHTLLGERGAGLSIGQAQRLCIARALLSEAPLLLLDEATSALDQITERTVLTNIKKHIKNKTCIAITHRDSVLSLCEQVFELKDYQFHPVTPRKKLLLI